MSKSQNPLRDIAADRKFEVEGGTGNLVANRIYSVEDIVKPLMTYDPVVGDPRLFVSDGHRRSKVSWRKVNKKGWIGPEKPSTNDKDTVLQIKFAKPKKFNILSFELLRVPQLWSVKYYDSSRKKMVDLTDTRGKKVAGSLSGFRVNTTSPGKNKKESKKWRRFDYKTPTISTNLIEIHLNREVKNPPIENLDDFFGFNRNTPYSLGVRNLKIKFRVRGDGDVDPDDDDDGGGNPSPIGTTERAVIKRHTSIMAHDGGEVSYWECAPQGAATSVVPYYLDLRQSDGTESIFDTLKLVPLWPGPSMSVYFSNDDTTLPWSLSPNRTTLETRGDVSPGFDEDSGLLVENADSAYFLDNTYMRVETSKNLVGGVQWTPTFTNSGNDRWLWNFEASGHQLGLKFDPTSSGASAFTGQFKVMEDSTNVLATFNTSYDFDIDTTYAVVVGYNQNDLDSSHPKGWYLSVSEVPGTNSTITHQFTQGVAPTGFIPDNLRIGTNLAMDRSARGYLSHLWFKLDGYTRRTATNFLLSPDGFIAGEGDAEQRTHGHYNGVLAANLTKSTEVRVGPGAGYFRSKVWTPIPIDYSLATTQYQMPVTKAKFLKLEFSNLVPRTYLTDLEELPVTDFPAWVKDWHRSVAPSRDNSTGYGGRISTGRNLYEGIPPLRNPGDRRKHPRLTEILEGRGGGGVPPITFHRDMASADAMENPELFDGVGLYKDLEFAATPLRFHIETVHTYVTHSVDVQRRAFFVGIKELEVYRSDHTVLMDTPEYNETYDDEQYLASSTGWINVGSSQQAGDVGDVLLSEEFLSFSKFNTIQAAVLDHGWETPMTREQIDLGDLTHLTDPSGTALASSTSTLRTYVTGRYQGARGGNVIELSRAGTGEYGIRTESGLFNGFDGIIGDNPRTSAVVRMQLPKTNNGTYELRIYAFDGELTSTRRLVAVKPIRIPIKSWQEVELAYVANDGELDWQAEVVQTNPNVSEPFTVDMLGIWQGAVKWEFSNDGGDTWQVALWPLNKPNGYIRFNEAGNSLVIKATALREGAIVSGWTVVPWYIESPMVVRAPIDLYPPWGMSDSDALRDTSHKPMFRLWNHWFPQGYSVNLYGYN